MESENVEAFGGGRLGSRADQNARDRVGNIGREVLGGNLPVRGTGGNQIDCLQDVLRVAASENV